MLLVCLCGCYCAHKKIQEPTFNHYKITVKPVIYEALEPATKAVKAPLRLTAFVGDLELDVACPHARAAVPSLHEALLYGETLKAAALSLRILEGEY